MSARAVGLLDELTDEQHGAFMPALPHGRRASWNDGGIADARAVVVRDSDIGLVKLGGRRSPPRVVRIDPGKLRRRLEPRNVLLG